MGRFTRREGLAAALSLAVLGSAAEAATRRGPSTIPFVFDDARVWLPVRFGRDAEVRNFILDTGASDVGLDSALAARLGLHPAPVGVSGGAGAGTSPIGRLPATTVHVGGVRLRAPEVTTAPLEALIAATSGRHAPGIIGAPFFKAHVVELDFEAGRLRLHDPARFRYRGPGAQIALTFLEDLPAARGSLILPDGRVVQGRFLVDLGAKSTLLLTEPFIAREGLRAAFPRTVVSPLGAGIGGPTRYAFARARRLTLGDAVLATPVVGLSVAGTLKSDAYDALIGADFLSRFRAIFDYSRSRLILEPRRPPLEAEGFDRSGAFVRASGPDLRTFTIQEVLAGSPAEAAGLAAGQEIVAVDGRSVGALTLGGLRRVLKDPAREAVTLAILAHEAPQEFTVRLRDLL